MALANLNLTTLYLPKTSAKRARASDDIINLKAIGAPFFWDFMSTIDEIKDRVDIVDLVSETVQLKRSGRNYSGFCPFHSNTRTPAFVVFPDTGTWRCFGHCAEGGDIFKYVMKREGVDFPEALRLLAERAGVELRKRTPQQQAREDEHDRLRDLLQEAVVFFQQQLTKTEAGRPALNYLQGRGLTGETIAAFELGYAPGGWNTLTDHFQKKGYTIEELLAAGLLSENEEKGTRYDRFRDRVIFPIRDQRGRVSGFGARALRDEDQPKYLNSPQTALFDKSRLLYGLDKARKPIRAEDQVVIVEGYMDVIGLHQAGYHNVIASMGTALTEQQLRQLKRFTRRIILALDADAAGASATLRGLRVARETLDREADPVFDARGLLHNEGRLQADIRVTALAGGKDPDEIVRENPEAWAAIIAAARPVVVHVMETLAQGRDLNDPKVKTEIAGQVLPLIADLPNAIERDTYTQQLARLLRIDERTLNVQKPARRAPQRRRSAPRPQAAPDAPQVEAFSVRSGSQRLEIYCLGVVMRRPELLYRVDRALQEAGLERISGQDFQQTNHQELFRLAFDSLNQDHLEPLEYTLHNLPAAMIDIADEFLTNTQNIDPSEQRVQEDLLRTILHMRRANLRERSQQLRFLQEEAQQGGNLRAAEYQQAMLSISNSLNKIDHALASIGRAAIYAG
jgi:DNA primase